MTNMHTVLKPFFLKPGLLKPRLLNPILIIGLLAGAGPLQAQSPYAGQEVRDIKALSSTEIDDYLNGRGMGYAKAAELNNFPGPRHVLDLSAELALNETQRDQSTQLFQTMQARAMELGKQLVAKEQELDQLFAEQRIDATALKTLLNEIGDLQAQLRYTHLEAHLSQTALLNPQQVQHYNMLRGYNNTVNTEHDRHQHGH